jgi:hypothetical protein
MGRIEVCDMVPAIVLSLVQVSACRADSIGRYLHLADAIMNVNSKQVV